MCSDNLLLKIENISLKFDDKIIYKNFSLNLKKGEKILLQGKSGSGKSSLLKIILGFITPTSGDIYLNNIKLNNTTIWEIRQLIAYVPQEPVLEDGNVLEAITTPLSYKANIAKSANLAKIETLLKNFGLTKSILQQQTTELSGGEKQRIAIITALLLERPLILLDEASSALDPESCKKIVSFFHNKNNISLIAVSHDNEWNGIASKTIVINEKSQNNE